MKLGQWAGLKRGAYRKGTLSNDLISYLERLPDWTWEPDDVKLEEHFSALLKFVNREEHALVKKDHREGKLGLGSGVLGS